MRRTEVTPEAVTDGLHAPLCLDEAGRYVTNNAGVGGGHRLSFVCSCLSQQRFRVGNDLRPEPVPEGFVVVEHWPRAVARIFTGALASTEPKPAPDES